MTTVGILQEYFSSQSDKGKDLDPVASLIEKGLLDSMAIVKLISFLEERFRVELSDDEFDPDHFETITAIAELVARKQAAK